MRHVHLHCALAILLSFAFGGALFALQPAEPAAPPTDPAAPPAGAQPPDRPRNMPPDGRRGVDDLARHEQLLNQLRQEMVAKLDLGAEQQEDLAAMLDEHRASVREKAEAPRQQSADQREAMRDLMQEMREAREKGDQERVDEIRKELVAMRTGGFNLVELDRQFLEEIRTELLTEEQAKRFDEMARKFMEQLSNRDSAMRGMRALRQAVLGMELSEEQREAVGEIMAKSMQESREAMGDGEAMTALQKRVREAILAELEEGQRAEFERRLDEAMKSDQQGRPRDGRGPGGGRGGDERGGERGGRPADAPRPATPTPVPADSGSGGAHEDPNP